MKQSKFFARAEQMGHSVEHLKAGHAIRSTITIPDVDALREFMQDDSDAGQREQTQRLMIGGAGGAEDDASEAAMMRRVYAFVYGNSELADEDRERIEAAFPLEVQTESVPDVRYTGKNVLATSAAPLVLNYGTVTFDDQAYVTVYNTPLTFTCDSIVRNGSPPPGFGDFNILGATGATGSVGDVGTAGTKGTNGSNGNCSSAGIADRSGSNGNTGTSGGTGTTGGSGKNGLASMPATINITRGFSVADSLYVLTRSGTGGVGGTGGTGGVGGAGGNGGNGATCGCTGSGAGNGAPGGSGGAGGNGGMGGAGTNAAGNIVVKLPAAQTGQVIGLAENAPPGGGGAGGKGGSGGAGGSKGSGGKHNGDGNSGSAGSIGATGTVGMQGPGMGNPATVSALPI
jgi:hypothetical protein